MLPAGGGVADDDRFTVVLGEELSKVSAAMSSCLGSHADVVAPYLTELTTEEQERVLGLSRNGGMIEAIKLHRELTGSGLAAAKRAVEAMQGD